jgi:hypothetical protein
VLTVKEREMLGMGYVINWHGNETLKIWFDE